MKTTTSCSILASAILGCASAMAQQAPPPSPGGAPQVAPPPGAGAPPLAPPRGEQPGRPPGGDRFHPPGARLGGPDGRPGAEGAPRRPEDGERGRDGRHGEAPDAGRPHGLREGLGEHEHEHGLRDGAEDREHGPRDGAGEREHGLRAGGDEHERGPRQGPQAFLGVVTAPVMPPLAAQLGLPEGFGLIVLDVLPDSPAATAGVQKFDVLKMFDDQQLVDMEQLAKLVHAAGKDSAVSLTVIRRAQEQKLQAKIGERDGGGHSPRGAMEGEGGPGRALEGMQQRLQDRMRELQNRVRQFPDNSILDRMRERREQEMHRNPGPGGEARPPRQGGGPEAGAPIGSISPEDLLREAKPGGGSQIQVVSKTAITTLEGAKSRLLLKDHDGEIEVASEDGKRTLTARDPQGKVTFTGPVDTEEERQAVPKEFQSKLSSIRLQQQPAGSASAAVSTDSSGGSSISVDVR